MKFAKGVRPDEGGWVRHPACYDGFKGPAPKPQRDGSRRNALGVSGGLQRAAHLDFDPFMILGCLDQLGHSIQHLLPVLTTTTLLVQAAPAQAAHARLR